MIQQGVEVIGCTRSRVGAFPGAPVHDAERVVPTPALSWPSSVFAT